MGMVRNSLYPLKNLCLVLPVFVTVIVSYYRARCQVCVIHQHNQGFFSTTVPSAYPAFSRNKVDKLRIFMADDA